MSGPCETLASPGLVRGAAEEIRDSRRLALAVLTEGTGRSRAHLAAVGLCSGPGVAYHVPDGPGTADADELLRELRPLLGSGGPPRVSHDTS